MTVRSANDANFAIDHPGVTLKYVNNTQTLTDNSSAKTSQPRENNSLVHF